MVVRSTTPPEPVGNTQAAVAAARATTTSNVRPLRRTNQNAYHAIPTLPGAQLARRAREASAATNAATPGAETERRGRGRRRTLPLMTNSERARYYRRKHAEETDALAAATVQLRRDVSHLEIRLRIHRQLASTAMAPPALRRIVEFVQYFVEEQLHTKSHGLQRQRHEIQAVELRGDSTAPIIRVDSVLRGRLKTPVIHSIYPFVLGNSIVLDDLMHQQITYACVYLFFFTSDGSLQRESVEIDTIPGLRGPLQSLGTVARVMSGVDVHVVAESTPELSRTRRREAALSTISTF